MGLTCALAGQRLNMPVDGIPEGYVVQAQQIEPARHRAIGTMQEPLAFLRESPAE